ncbi:nuclear transport factor 2 family protein [Rhodococcus spelaei]|uniref:Nuclear transport factor 2 family protein n=1 Tax=Rhodococcus spelaei TaxID=2546320 RepID=A0A541BQI6_9NOCA|nr:nuclear transport factor 2 family protein [Rhodococcus spelaei]TQF74549.1 nuclear transport factor 2 family protein [Rhodococcus spelaei]
MTDSTELVGRLVERVQLLEDKLDIMQIISAYGPAVDSGSAEAVAGLWTEDGVYDVDTGSMTGHSEIEAMVHSRNHQSYIHGGCAHLVGPPHIVLDGDTAVATCHSQLVMHDGESKTNRVARITANRWEFARIDGQWKVTVRTNRLLDGRAEAREILAAGVTAQP